MLNHCNERYVSVADGAQGKRECESRQMNSAWQGEGLGGCSCRVLLDRGESENLAKPVCSETIDTLDEGIPNVAARDLQVKREWTRKLKAIPDTESRRACPFGVKRKSLGARRRSASRVLRPQTSESALVSIVITTQNREEHPVKTTVIVLFPSCWPHTLYWYHW